MTTKDSILALAAKISNGTVPNVATDAQALGELAKAMCGTAPEVPLATVDDAIAFITANYSGGGGGGGGDFTTATVTLQAAEGSTVALQLECACVAPEDLPDATFAQAYSEDTSVEFTAVLYKGKALAYSTIDDVTLTTTGDVAYDADLEMYVITGDCTFTFSNA